MESVGVKSIKREEWIDLLRAFAMFMVVFAHTINSDRFYQLFAPVIMPLFYFLSGFFLGFKKDFVSYIKGIIYRMVLPMFVFSAFPLFVVKYAVLGSSQEALAYIKSFLLGFEVWFIPSFMITQVLCYGLYHLLKKNELLVFVVSVGCFFLGILLRDVSVLDIWSMNTALTGVFFAMSGKLFFVHRDVIISKYISKTWVFAIALLLYCVMIGLTLRFYPDEAMSFHHMYYYNIPICLILIISSFTVCIFIALKIKPNVLTKYVTIMGQNTLVIYLASGIVAIVLFKVFGVIGLKTKGFNLVESLIVSIIECVVCTIISVICGKVCPILIGKKK